MKTYRKPHSYKRKKSILKNRFFWLGILIFVSLFSIFYFLFFYNTFQVEKIVITGENKVSTENLKVLIENKLENKILFFKTKTIFLVDLNEIKEDILNNFPQIAEVEVKKGFPDAIDVVVVERTGLASWCRNEQCFLLDKEGIVFEQAPQEAEINKIIDERNSNPVALGQKVIEKENLNQIISDILPALNSLEIPVKEFVISSEDKLTVLTQESWEIYFSFQSDIPWQITKLRAVLDEKIPPEKRKDLEYIEVRFGNFAPYKYKD